MVLNASKYVRSTSTPAIEMSQNFEISKQSDGPESKLGDSASAQQSGSVESEGTETKSSEKSVSLIPSSHPAFKTGLPKVKSAQYKTKDDTDNLSSNDMHCRSINEFFGLIRADAVPSSYALKIGDVLVKISNSFKDNEGKTHQEKENVKNTAEEVGQNQTKDLPKKKNRMTVKDSVDPVYQKLLGNSDRYFGSCKVTSRSVDLHPSCEKYMSDGLGMSNFVHLNPKSEKEHIFCQGFGSFLAWNWQSYKRVISKLNEEDQEAGSAVDVLMLTSCIGTHPSVAYPYVYGMLAIALAKVFDVTKLKKVLYSLLSPYYNVLHTGGRERTYFNKSNDHIGQFYGQRSLSCYVDDLVLDTIEKYPFLDIFQDGDHHAEFLFVFCCYLCSNSQVDKRVSKLLPLLKKQEEDVYEYTAKKIQKKK